MLFYCLIEVFVVCEGRDCAAVDALKKKGPDTAPDRRLSHRRGTRKKKKELPKSVARSVRQIALGLQSFEDAKSADRLRYFRIKMCSRKCRFKVFPAVKK